jgi:hypothetical protein
MHRARVLACTLTLAAAVTGCLAGELKYNDGDPTGDAGRPTDDAGRPTGGPTILDGGQPAGDGAAPTPGCSISTWAPGVPYGTGQVVEWHGAYYQCLQSHVSQSSWAPDTTPALWLPVAAPSDCQGPAADGGASAPADGGAPVPGDGGGGPIGPPGATEYAPYFYTWGWGNAAYPFTSLMELKNASGLSAVTLAFVIASGSSCAVSNDGWSNIIETQMVADIAAFRAAGGRLKVSFGGAVGTYLEVACATASALEATLAGFVERTGLADLDFDVEQWEAMTATVNTRRAQAFVALQAAHPEVEISFTLPVMPTGLVDVGASDTVTLLRTTAQAGVRVKHVNLMTMDYGNVPGTMGDLAVQAVQSTLAQLRGVYPAATDAQLYALLGATPMIGQNDVAGEVFSLTDAQTLTTFARQHGLGLVSFWAINRDQPCNGGGLATCSQAQTAAYAFHDVFKVLQ